MSMQPKIVTAGDGPPRQVLTETIRIVLRSDDTAGTCALGEVTVPPGGGPPPHIHHREEEVFYILDGELDLFANGTWTTATAGDTAFLPRGQTHAFRNNSSRPCRFLVFITPGGFEQYFSDVSELAAREPITPAVAIDRGLEFGVEFLAG